MAFWRGFFRKRMHPLQPDYAKKMKNRLSALYFLIAWNLFGLAIYKWTKRAIPPKNDDLESSSRYYSRMMGLGEGKIYHYKGFELVEKFDNSPPEKQKSGQPLEDSKDNEKTLPNEDLELLVEETGSL